MPLFFVEKSFCHALTKIIGKIEEKNRKLPPTSSKWEYFCQNWRIIRQF